MGYPADDTRLYFAEWNLHKMGLETRLSDPQGFLKAMQSSQLVRNRWPVAAKKTIKIRDRGDTEALSWYKEGLIDLPPWARTDLTLIHEFAHFCVPSRRIISRGLDKHDHGPNFIGAELALVRRFMGKRSHNCLKHSLLAMEIGWE